MPQEDVESASACHACSLLCPARQVSACRATHMDSSDTNDVLVTAKLAGKGPCEQDRRIGAQHGGARAAPTQRQVVQRQHMALHADAEQRSAR